MTDISSFPKFHIYSDESSQTKHRYLVIGATICTARTAPKIASDISGCSPHVAKTSELKWGKVKKHNLSMYKSAVDCYFDGVDKNHLQFYAIVVDTHESDHNTYNDGDREIGFSKYLFTLLFKFARIWPPKQRLYVFLDDRTTKHTPEATRRMLNAKSRKKHSIDYDIYRKAEFCKSERSRLIQMTDIVTGAIAFETNSHHNASNAAAHKIELLKHITGRAKLATLAKPSPYMKKGVDIWHLDFSKSKKK